MRNTIYILACVAFGALLSGCTGESQSDYTVCEGIYALCTTAQCQPIVGQDETVSCDCTVKTGYSLGLEPCKGEADTAKGKQIISRYFPIKSYAICANDRPWANCLDSPCVVNESDPSKTACACPVVKDQGPYVMVTETYDASTCATGLWSSATVIDANKVTDFLKTNDKLKPFDVKVLNPE
ncbi:MAG: hypothetical protein ACRECX_13745 [Methyloceanibacter sp.]|uniref:hypothetical protein n=1 Tax=Methyloceanibacter sp. TaxID=1965321 RepID=UPI003D6D6BDE